MRMVRDAHGLRCVLFKFVGKSYDCAKDEAGQAIRYVLILRSETAGRIKIPTNDRG